MTRSMLAITTLLVLTSTAGLRADVTVTNTMTFTGPMAAMIGGGTPQLVMRIKGTRARMDVDMMTQKMSTVMDIDAKQVTLLQHALKTAQVMDIAQMAASLPPGASMPKIDGTVEPTGRRQDINGQSCSEYTYSMTLDMANMASMANMTAGRGSQQLPPGAAEMFKDLKMTMTGSVWVAKEGPGVAEYVRFTKAAQGGMMPFSPFGGGGMPAAPGMEEMMRAFSQLDGMAYQTDIETSFEGTSPMLDMIKAMGTMKITTKISNISTEPVPDDLFQIPADYTVTKQ